MSNMTFGDITRSRRPMTDGEAWGEWRDKIDRPGYSEGGMTWTYGSKPKVSKVKLWPSDIAQPWIVTNHQLGSRRFRTWREAMDYALTRPIMMNATTVQLWDRHEHIGGRDEILRRYKEEGMCKRCGEAKRWKVYTVCFACKSENTL